MKQRLLASLVILAFSISLVACGGGGDDKPSSSGDDGGSGGSSGGGGSASATTDSGGQGGGGATATTAGGRKFVADLGFRPDKDGFKFENFGNQYPDSAGTLTLTEVQKMFGPQAVCETTAVTCTPNPGALLWLDAANKSSNGGHCEGFAVTSLRLFKKLDDVQSFGGSKVQDLALDGNVNLRHYIAYYMASQMVEPSASVALSYKQKTPKDILADIIASMKDGSDPLTMGIYKPGGGGHAIVPYAVEDKGNGIYWVLIYDNNWPNQERYIEIDVNKNTWIYNFSATNPTEAAEAWAGDATTFTLDLTPLSARDGVYVCPWCGKNAVPNGAKSSQKKAVAFSGDGNLTVTDRQGRKLTYVNGVLKSDIPGAGIAESKLAPKVKEDNPLVYIYLPADGDFTVNMTGQGLPKGESGRMKESVFVFGQGNAFEVDDFDLGDDETDVLTISADTNKVGFKTSGTEKPHVRMALDSDTGPDYLFDLTDLDFESGEEIDFAVDETTGKFDIKDIGGKPDKYNVKIVREDASGEHTFVHKDVDLAPGETDLFNYGSWDGQDGHAMKVEEDTNSDGTVDTSASEEDEG